MNFGVERLGLGFAMFSQLSFFRFQLLSFPAEAADPGRIGTCRFAEPVFHQFIKQVPDLSLFKKVLQHTHIQCLAKRLSIESLAIHGVNNVLS